MAGVAQPGYLDDRLVTEMEPRAARQAEQVDPARRDVLAHQPGGDGEAGLAQLVE